MTGGASPADPRQDGAGARRALTFGADAGIISIPLTGMEAMVCDNVWTRTICTAG